MFHRGDIFWRQHGEFLLHLPPFLIHKRAHFFAPHRLAAQFRGTELDRGAGLPRGEEEFRGVGAPGDVGDAVARRAANNRERPGEVVSPDGERSVVAAERQQVERLRRVAKQRGGEAGNADESGMAGEDGLGLERIAGKEESGGEAGLGVRNRGEGNVDGVRDAEMRAVRSPASGFVESGAEEVAGERGEGASAGPGGGGPETQLVVLAERGDVLRVRGNREVPGPGDPSRPSGSRLCGRRECGAERGGPETRPGAGSRRSRNR